MSRSESTTFRPAGVLLAATKAWGALEFAHERGQRLHRFKRHGVVQGNAHAADTAVAGRPGNACCRGFLGKLFFDGFVAARHAKNHVHLGARFAFHRTRIESVAFNGSYSSSALASLRLVMAADAAFGFNPSPEPVPRYKSRTSAAYGTAIFP